MSLHREISFEDEICAHLAGHGWCYSEEPALKLAERYGISSSMLARICTRLNVPRPGGGYWWAKPAQARQSLFKRLGRRKEGVESGASLRAWSAPRSVVRGEASKLVRARKDRRPRSGCV